MYREKKRELLEETDEKDVRDIERFEEVKIKRDVGKDEKVVKWIGEDEQ